MLKDWARHLFAAVNASTFSTRARCAAAQAAACAALCPTLCIPSPLTPWFLSPTSRWDLAEGKRLYSLDAGDIIHSLVFSPNRYWLCAATQSCIKIWDLE